MAISPETARLVELDLLAKADVLAHYLKSLAENDSALAGKTRDEILARLNNAVPVEPLKTAGVQRSLDHPRPVILPLRRETNDESDDEDDDMDVEEYIMENLLTSPLGLSVQEIVDRLKEADVKMKRRTLVVRLRRMVLAGKVTTRAHGHYTLSEAEHQRRAS